MTQPSPLDVLGERIRTRRRELGLTQQDLAERASLHWTFVGQVERGQRNLSLNNLLKLAGALDVDVAVLVSGLTRPPG